ncbi:MAG TPA: hypothetical protein VFT86_06960, partial [Gaiellaceae bacterium]|nr:hypothetical protein [Gaiellaceae bacterium]
MKRNAAILRRPLVAALLVGAVAGAIFSATADAHHVRGAFYNGTHSGPPPGQSGTVEFLLGSNIQFFRLNNIAGSICTFTNVEFNGPIRISSGEPHSFSLSNGEATLSGTFHALQAAQGTAHLSAPFPPFGTCTADVTWTATTTELEPPPPPPPP